MKGVRLAAAVLCVLLVLAVPAMADDGWELTGVVDPNDMPALEQPAEPSPESPPAPEPAPPAEPPQEPTGDSAGNNAGDSAEPSHELDDNLWGVGLGDWNGNPGGPNTELPSEAQQELEEARRELEEKQQQRDEAFREAERENAALPEEEEKQKKPAGSKAADAAPTELVLPQREARTGSPVRYILIGALLAGALCIAIYLFTHPAREDDPADETKP